MFLGFLTLDVFGAQDASWFGGLGDEGFLVLLGTVLTVAAVGTSRRGSPAPGCAAWSAPSSWSP